MVGTVVDGQLASAAPARPRPPVRFALATHADDSAIRRLLRENPMRGAITLTLEREPDYFLGSNIGGANDQVIVAFDAGRLVCMGRCTTREAWLNGDVRRIGYLAELRLDASVQGRFDLLRGGYRFFRQLHESNPADFYYTSIATDNVRARRLLERGLPGFPRYEYLGDLTTLLISTQTSAALGGAVLGGARCPHRAGLEVDPPKPDGDIGLHLQRHESDLAQSSFELEPLPPDELAMLLNSACPKHHLSARWTAECLRSLRVHDLPIESFGAIRRRGEIVAVAALWDQRRFRQTVVRAYAPALRLARPFINTLGHVFGFPSLPAPGAVLPHASLSPLAIAPGNEALLPDLVAAFCPRAAAQGIDFITVALSSHDARLTTLRRRFRCRAYTSRLYRVSWPGNKSIPLDDRPVLPDVALL